MTIDFEPTVQYDASLSFDKALENKLRLLTPEELKKLMLSNCAARNAAIKHCEVSLAGEQIDFLQQLVAYNQISNKKEKVAFVESLLEGAFNPDSPRFVNIGDLSTSIVEIQTKLNEIKASSDVKTVEAAFIEISQELKKAEDAVALLLTNDVLKRTDIEKLSDKSFLESRSPRDPETGQRNLITPLSQNAEYQSEKKTYVNLKGKRTLSGFNRLTESQDLKVNVHEGKAQAALIRTENERILALIEEALSKLIKKTSDRVDQRRQMKVTALTSIKAAALDYINEHPESPINFAEVLDNAKEISKLRDFFKEATQGSKAFRELESKLKESEAKMSPRPKS